VLAAHGLPVLEHPAPLIVEELQAWIFLAGRNDGKEMESLA
jgi:hypothetical protein